MIRIQKAFALSLLGFAAISASAQQFTSTQASFKVIDNPGGGQYIYGPLSGRGNMPDAIVYMLRQVHNYVGDRPEVGKFFQSRDGTSVSTFFTATAKTRGNLPIAGLLIVSRAADGSATAAVLLDAKSHFGTSEPAMMKSLQAVWQPVGAGTPGAAAPGAAAPGAAAPSASQGNSPSAHPRGPAPLVQATGGDRSAVISLPAGWKVTSVASGTLSAAGPNGEMLFLGGLYQGFQMGPDLFENFVNITNQYRRKNGLPAGTYNLISKINVPGNAIQVMFNVDLNDGVGLRKGSVRLGSWGPRAMSVDGSNIPVRFAEEENATLLAVIRSFQQNAQMMAQLRQGAMNRVQADAARANAQSAALNARREASNAAFDAHMDNLDRSSKINQDYILDRTVVRDTENAERGTLSNSYAESLVRSNPDRFQIVPNQDLIKGKDY
ncbi:MAG: hypothetical protein ABJD53_12095 [Gammaproteobacteria bacterium]